MFDKLEDQMCTFSIDLVRNASEGSPDRVDALVWGLTELFDKIAGRRRAPTTDERNSLKGKLDYQFDVSRYYDEHPTMWMAG